MLPVIINIILVVMTVFISNVFLITLLLKWDRIFDDPRIKNYPNITIAVPARNEEKHIAKTLQCLLNLKYPKKIRIIVINDGSKDRTADIVREFPVELINKKISGGKANALNDALKRTKSELFGFIDAETFIDKNALMHIIGYFNDKKIGAVTPSMYVYNAKKTIEKLQGVEYAFSMMSKKILTFLNCLYVTPGCAFYRTDIIKKVGGFDEKNLTEDLEVALHINKYGYQIENSVNAKVWTVVPDTIKKLIRQRIRWYRGTIHNLVKYKSMFGNNDIGLFVMPIMLICGMFILLMYAFMIGFSILEFIYNLLTYSFAFILSDFSIGSYSIPFTQNILLTFSIFLFAIFMVNIYFSEKISGTPLFRNFKELLLFLLVYSPILAIALIISIIKIIKRSENKW